VGIAFAQTVAAGAAQVGVDPVEVPGARRTATRGSRCSRRASASVGTACPSTVVPRAAAPEEAELVRVARAINDAVPGRIVERILAQMSAPGARVAVLGLAYKADVDDVPERAGGSRPHGVVGGPRRGRVCDPLVEAEPVDGLRHVGLHEALEADARAARAAPGVRGRRQPAPSRQRLIDPTLDVPDEPRRRRARHAPGGHQDGARRPGAERRGAPADGRVDRPTPPARAPGARRVRPGYPTWSFPPSPRGRPAHSLAHLVTSIGALIATRRPELVLVTATPRVRSAAAGGDVQPGAGRPRRGRPCGRGCATSRFPEEMNRVLVDRASNLWFAPTERARDALLAEGCPRRSCS
jgi:hypothetical protein